MNAAQITRWIEVTRESIASVIDSVERDGEPMDAETTEVMNGLIVEMFEAHAMVCGGRCV